MAFSFGATPGSSPGFSFGASSAGTPGVAASSATLPTTFSSGVTASPSAASTPSAGFSFNLNAFQSAPGTSATPTSAAGVPAASTGLSFGFSPSLPATAASSSAAGSTASSASISFGSTVASLSTPAAGSTQTPAAGSSPAASTGFNFGAPSTTGASSSAPAGSTVAAATPTLPSSSFSFSQPGTAAAGASSSGFSFGTPATSSSQAAAAGASASLAGQGLGTAAATASGQQTSAVPVGNQPAQAKQPLSPVQLFLKPADASSALVPASYGTRFEDLHPESQKMLLQVEGRIRECRAEAATLSKSDRLAELKGGTKTSKHDLSSQVARVKQRLSTVAASVARENTLLNRALLGSYALLQQAEVAVRSFSLLAYRFPQLHITTGLPAEFATQDRGPQAQELSPYLVQTIERFETHLSEFEHKLEELERVLLGPVYAFGARQGMNGFQAEWGSGASSAAAVLPSLLRNLHSFLIHVAAQMEPVHEAVEDAKAAFLADRRRRGDLSDPFLDVARQDEERERGMGAMDGGVLRGGASGVPGLGAGFSAGAVNPALLAMMPGGGMPLAGTSGMGGAAAQLGAVSQPPVGAPTPLFGASPSAFGASQSPSFGFGATQTLPPFGAGSSTFPSFSSSPAFGTPAPAGAASSSLFGAASTPAFGATTGFGAPASSAPSFGAPSSTPSLFGSSAPSLFGAAPAPAFGSSAPAFGGSTFGASTGSAFGTPPSISIPGGPGSFGFGASTGNLTNSKPASTRSRSGRRR